MAKLVRVTQKVFGVNGNSNYFGQFGSKASGSPVQTLDPASIQQLAAFTDDGWKNAIVGGNKQPFVQDMNGLFRVSFYQIAQIFQDGIPVWDGGTSYYIGSMVRKDGTFELYGSVINDNVGNALPSQTTNGNWQYLNPVPVPPGAIFDFGGSTVPFGYLACDGTVYSQASYAALFSAIGTAWNTGGEGGGNFRVPDLRGRTGIGVGQGSGLSNRTLGQTLGEEVHMLTIPEMPTHSHGYKETQFNTPAALSGHDVPSGAQQGDSTDLSGGNGSHNNMQPSAVVTKMIKY